MVLTYPTRSKPKFVAAAAVFLGFGLLASPAALMGDEKAPAPTTQPTSEDSIARWFSDLNSSDASVRNTARLHLMRLNQTQLDELREIVEKSRPLAPAQAAALRQIVREVFLANQPYDKDKTHGFLGILMDSTALTVRDIAGQPDSDSPGVVVADRIPGFCASRTLLDGDVILGLADSPTLFRNATDLQFAIGSLEAGTTVHLKILRHGQIMNVSITLDAHPKELDQDRLGERFRVERTAQFEAFWRQNFAPLMKDDGLTSVQVNASK